MPMNLYEIASLSKRNSRAMRNYSHVIHITFVQRNKRASRRRLSILGILILTWIFILFPPGHEIGFGLQFGFCNYFLIVHAYTYVFIHLFLDILTFFFYHLLFQYIYIYIHVRTYAIHLRTKHSTSI